MCWYGCGFHWLARGTPFCGFGVWTSSDLRAWEFKGPLFDPAAIDSWNGQTWTWTCGSGGQGCFNPRMLRRPDGRWILWFNAPGDFARSRANAYYALECASPVGPCGGAHKPGMPVCHDNGDFSIAVDGASAYIVCTMVDQTLAVDRLDPAWTDGTGVGSGALAGLTAVEAPGLFEGTDGTWYLTYSDPNCGYCAGDGTGYATAAGPLGPWTAPGNTGFHAPATGRRDISATSCGGQPRAVYVLGGQPYEWIDLWGQWDGDATNQTRAAIRLEPLVVSTLSDDALWRGGIAPVTCR